jgi:SET domain-containing protein
MALLEQQLLIKRSNIPGAGKGLFTKQFIAKGTRIIEYKGRVTTWKEVVNGKSFNGYVYYISRNHVIDAKPYKKALARYANDAKGITKILGFTNNTKYVRDGGKVFINAIKDIEAGKEMYVGYGKEYWDVIKYNNNLALK